MSDDWGYSVDSETEEYERQRAMQYAAVSDASTKADEAAARAAHPVYVWCPLREQFIDTPICARMQSQARIVRKCKVVRCHHQGSSWSESLITARRKEDPKDKSLGYLKTEQYRVTKGQRQARKKAD